MSTKNQRGIFFDYGHGEVATTPKKEVGDDNACGLIFSLRHEIKD
jgi:hypothetical protein